MSVKPIDERFDEHLKDSYGQESRLREMISQLQIKIAKLETNLKINHAMSWIILVAVVGMVFKGGL